MGELSSSAQASGEKSAMAFRRLVAAVQALSLARSLAEIQEIVRHAARELTGADGASFVLRDGEQCFYADEDAIAPLWKGRRFPLTACISGWTMLHRQAAMIPDIYADPRIPHDAYRPTFVKSLVMVPVRAADPIGAIGNYWASPHAAGADEIELLQSLANTTAVAIENAQLYAQLEQRVRERTLQLETANAELEAFAYSVSHDLRAPLRAIDGFSQALQEDAAGRLEGECEAHLQAIRRGVKRMDALIDDLLRLSRISRAEMRRQVFPIGKLAAEVAAALRQRQPERQVDFQLEPGLEAEGDPELVRIVLENLLGNAWKFTARASPARIFFGRQAGVEPAVYCVRDNGAGFEAQYAGRLFAPFQRLHSAAQFPGSGIGLATVQRIVRKHGGRVWAESQPERGASFYFTLSPPA